MKRSLLLALVLGLPPLGVQLAGPGAAPRRRRRRVLQPPALALLRPRPRLRQRVRPLRHPDPRRQGRGPPPPAIGGRSSRWDPRCLDAVLRGGRSRGPPGRSNARTATRASTSARCAWAASPTAWPACCSCRSLLEPLFGAARRRLDVAAAALRHLPLLVRRVRARDEPRAELLRSPPSPSRLVGRAARPAAGPRPGPGPRDRPRRHGALAERRAAAPAGPEPASRLARRATRATGPLVRTGALVLARLRPRRLAPAAGLEGDLRRSTCSPTRPTAGTSCASAIRSCSRPSSPRATACSTGRPSCGAASWASGCSSGATAFTALALAVPLAGDELRERLLGRLVGGRLLLEPALRLVLPLLALGLARRAGRAPGGGRRRPQAAWPRAGPRLRALEPAPDGAVPREQDPADDTVSFARSPATTPSSWRRSWARPLAWPANWSSPPSTTCPPRATTSLVGKYLFYRQNNLGGLVEGLGDDRADPALFAGDWSAPVRLRRCALPRGPGPGAGVGAPRRARGPRPDRARAQGEGTLALRVNGRASRPSPWRTRPAGCGSACRSRSGAGS